MRAAVINCSAPHYNLGAEKLANWLRDQGAEVVPIDRDHVIFAEGCDLVCLSVIFSWDVPLAMELAARYGGRCEVWAGGPGLFGDKKNGFALRDLWERATGNTAHVGLDQRFERQRGKYRMSFASRGCPVGCHFCIVPQLEGKEFTLYYDFEPAPILCDNNLSDLPVPFQEHIIQRYHETGVPLLDANSGFEPKSFDEGTFSRWKTILRGPWRFAFDYMPEWRQVKRVCEILRDEPAKKKQVYVLVGNEPMESCYERALKVIEWGGEPYCQAIMALDALEKKPIVQHDWTEPRLKHFCRFFNRHLWRQKSGRIPLADYRCRELAPFKGLKFAEVRVG